MSCTVDKCDGAAEFYCFDCPGIASFCKDHGLNHMIDRKHTAKAIDHQEKVFLLSKQLKQKIKTFIANITAESNSIISAVKSITSRFIKQVKEINKNIEKISDFVEIKFQEEALKNVTGRIKNLDKDIEVFEAQSIIEEFKTLKEIESELPNDIIKSLLDEKLERLARIIKKLEANFKEAGEELKINKNLDHEMKSWMMRIQYARYDYKDKTSFEYFTYYQY